MVWCQRWSCRRDCPRQGVSWRPAVVGREPASTGAISDGARRHRRAAGDLPTHRTVFHSGASRQQMTVHQVCQNVQHHRSALSDCLIGRHRIQSSSHNVACHRRRGYRRRGPADYQTQNWDVRSAHLQTRHPAPHPHHDHDHETKGHSGVGVGTGRRTCRTMLRPTSYRSAESPGAQASRRKDSTPKTTKNADPEGWRSLFD